MADEDQVNEAYIKRVIGDRCGAGMAPMGNHLYFRNIHPNRSIRIHVRKWWNDPFSSGEERATYVLPPNRNIGSTQPNEDDAFAGCTVDEFHNQIRYYEFKAEWA